MEQGTRDYGHSRTAYTLTDLERRRVDGPIDYLGIVRIDGIRHLEALGARRKDDLKLIDYVVLGNDITCVAPSWCFTQRQARIECLSHATDHTLGSEDCAPAAVHLSRFNFHLGVVKVRPLHTPHEIGYRYVQYPCPKISLHPA